MNGQLVTLSSDYLQLALKQTQMNAIMYLSKLHIPKVNPAL